MPPEDTIDAPTQAGSLAEHLAARNEPCPDCGYRLGGIAGDRCPECGLELTGELFIGLGRVLENVRLGVAWALVWLPFLAGLWSLAWAGLVVRLRLSKAPAPGVGTNPLERLSAAGELYGVTFHAIVGVAYLSLGVVLSVSKREWSGDRTWRLWLLAGCVLFFVHAPTVMQSIVS